jgi:hypothetical protein
MTQNEREKLPPPRACLTCEHLVTYRVAAPEINQFQERHHCGKGLPMHPGCAWYHSRPGK